MKIIATALGALCLLALLMLAPGCSSELGVSDARAQVRKLFNENGVGSGVVIAPGFVLTAQHVAVNPGLVLRAKGPKGSVLGLGDNDKVDLGLLYFPSRVAQCPCVKLADSEALPDEPVYVVGYPLGITQTLTRGSSQGVLPSVVVPGGMWSPPTVLGRRLVIAATIAPGNSGGGVFVFRDGEFQLVGILVESAYPGIGLAIPVSVVRQFLQEHL